MQSSGEPHASAAIYPRMKTESTEQVDAWDPQPFRTFREEKNSCALFCLLAIHLIEVGK